MSVESVQLLRKELKQWESAFYIVHQRKPAKNDIETAPQEIKEKKKINREVGDVLLSPHEREPQAASEVWGKEFNKTPTTTSASETKTSPIVTPAASLDKLGAKLFQNFAKSGPSVRPKGVFKMPDDSMGADFKNPVRKESSGNFQVCEDYKKKNILNSNMTATAVEGSGDLTRSRESSTEKNDPNFDEDFVVKGELFKSAGKLFTSKSSDSNLLKHQITSKPRLSFLSVNMASCGEVDASSDDITYVQDPSKTSELKNARFGSSAAFSDAVSIHEGEEPSTDSENNSWTGRLLHKGNTHLSKNTFAENFKLEKGRSRTTGCSTSSQHLSDGPKNNNQGCDSSEDFNGDEDLHFDESLHVCSRSTPDSPQQVHETTRVSNNSSNTKRRGKFSRNDDSEESIVSPTRTSLGAKCSESSKQRDTQTDPELKAGAKISPVSLQKSGKTSNIRTRKAVSAKKAAASVATKFSSACEEFADTNLTVSMDAKSPVKKKIGQGKKKKTLTVSSEYPADTMDDSASASVKNTGERKRKRSLDVSNGWPGDSNDDSGNISTNLSDEPEEFIPEDESTVSSGASSKAKKSSTSKRSAASMNENYVCLNMKRKGYRRKGAGMTGPQLKRKLWKAKMTARSKSFGSNKCFKCGQEGHWANKCTGKQKDSQDWSSYNANEAPVKESDFPSLREAALMGRGIKDDTDNNKNADDITDIEATIVRESGDSIEPLRSTTTLAEHIKDVRPEVYRALSVFGFASFRPGQEDCISRVLQGLSTLVVLSTGGGKSLCYQLPAYLYAKHLGAVTLVISPLVSLMEDQITGLPPGVVGACLHSNMTPSQREGVISSLREGKVHFLLVSPEAIVERGGANSGSFPSPDRMPPIAFACIDEAHCLSEWSHNFRPSYLRLCKVLRKRYHVTCFLGLTATATRSTAKDVARHLGIEDPESATIRGAAVPSNLVLSASRDESKDEALISLLRGDRFRSCESILIYCSRREHTERVATLIRTSMQTSVDLNDSFQPATKKQRTSKKTEFDPKIWNAESYHAGLTAGKRRTVQKAFMSGKLRVVVATVAFGMGLDKANVRAVIHYNMAKSFESYVQEIGRAGRDGLTSHCHAFLDSRDVAVNTSIFQLLLMY